MQGNEVYGWLPHVAYFLRVPMSNKLESKRSLQKSHSAKYRSRSRNGYSAARFRLRCSTDSSKEVRSANYSMRPFYGMRDFPLWLSPSVSFMIKSWHLFKAPIRSPLTFSLRIDVLWQGFETGLYYASCLD